MLGYLTDLVQNNSREWYHENKKRFQEAHAEFEGFLSELIEAISAFDDRVARFAASPKELTFKLVRDTRFSADKSPYNTTFRAHIGPMGKLPVPAGYFISIAPGNRSFLGGGLFAAMFKDATAMVRDYIVAHGPELQTIVSDHNFTENFMVDGEALKNVPKGYDPAHPQAEYIKHKSWYLEYPVPDAMLGDRAGFLRQAVQIFQAMKPFNDYLNAALKDFKMPER